MYIYIIIYIRYIIYHYRLVRKWAIAQSCNCSEVNGLVLTGKIVTGNTMFSSHEM
jgi:hypothetical protein